MRKPRRQTALDSLTPELRKAVAQCFEDHLSIPEIQAMLETQHGIHINKDPLYRFRQKEAVKLLLENRDELQEDSGALLQFAATGQADFTEGAIKIISQKAFELAVVAQTPADAAQLKSYFSILFAHRNTSVRERAVAVREAGLAIRQEQHAMKVKAAEKKEKEEAEKAEQAKQQHDPAAQKWGDPEWEEAEMERVWNLFQIPESERIKRRAANVKLREMEKNGFKELNDMPEPEYYI